MTPRQIEIAKHLANGLKNKQIAEQVGLSEKTVKAHITQIYKAYSVTSRAQFVRAYMLDMRENEIKA